MTDIKSDIMPSTGYARECWNVNKRTNATSPPPHHVAWNQTFWARFPPLCFDDLMTSAILSENELTTINHLLFSCVELLSASRWH